MNRQHHFRTTINWTGNRGQGTTDYNGYDRSHRLSAQNKPTIEVSSDSAFMGDPSKYNPEELFLASLSSCHMLWFLHLCSDNGVVVTAYEDHATGNLDEDKTGGGKFTEVILHPHVKVTHSSMIVKANELHEEANKRCFIANSCTFKIKHEAFCKVDLSREVVS